MEEKGYADSSIPIDVSSNALDKVIEYCRNRFEDRSGHKRAFDGFVKGIDMDEMRELVTAAYYLKFNELVDLLSKAIADRIQNKSVDYCQKFLGIQNDYPPEEEKAIRERYSWAFDDN